MDKKGMMMGGGRKIFTAILGLVFLALGIIPLLNEFGIISFNLPTIPKIIFWVLALLGAVVLIIDGFKEEREFGAAKTVGIISIVLALVLVVFGLGSFGVLPFAIPEFGMIVINILFVVAGIFLILGAFFGMS